MRNNIIDLDTYRMDKKEKDLIIDIMKTVDTLGGELYRIPIESYYDNAEELLPLLKKYMEENEGVIYKRNMIVGNLAAIYKGKLLLIAIFGGNEIYDPDINKVVIKVNKKLFKKKYVDKIEITDK